MAQKKPAGLLARLNNFSFKMKFLILATSTFVPLVIFMWLNIHQLNEDLQITQLEREGIVYLNPLRKFIDNVQNHRGMSNGYIAGNQSFRPKIDAKEKKTDALILEINKIEQQFGSRFGTSQNWAKLKQDWQSIKKHWAQVKSGTSTLSSKEIFNEHTVLINQLLAFMLQISDASTLTLDAQTDTYYVMDIVFLRTLDVIESMGKIRGLGSGVASRQAITAEERTKLSVLASQLKLSLGNFSHDMEVLEGYPSTYKQVKPNMDALQKSISGLYSLANNSIINADQITLDSKYYFAEATKPIALGYKTFDDLSALLDTLLSQRQAEQQSTLYKIGGLALLSILLVAGMMFSISNSIIGSANRAKKMMNNLANGDFSTKTNKTKYSNDEMGTVMRSADALENTLNALIASMTHVTKQHDAGDIDASIDTNAFKGGYAEMAQGVNTMVAGHIEMNKKILNCIKEFGAGNLDAELEKFPGKKAFANTAIEQVRDNVRALVDDANMLSKSAVEGQLSMRADTKKHQGQFREIIQGVNHTLDAVVGPLNVAANYVENIALGNIPEKITDTYNGDFNEIKNNLNVCIDNINNLISQMSNMTKQHNLGDIEAKVDEDKFHGAFKRMATEVNNMVFDQIAVIEQAMECIDGFGNGDFDTPMTTLPGKKAFINKTIEQVRSNLKALSADTNMLVNAATEGRVKVRVDATQHQGDFRKIVEGVNATLETIVQPIATVKEAVDTINTASGEISMGNNDLSSRTEQQAANLEETSSSMEVLATTVEQNANNAKKANELALEASKVAVKGGEAVEEVVTTMNNINNSSQKIEDIITVIDGIAFQTNILALNAAVEAARAGEQGRGFAVVAGEVRSLAQRSSSAAKEIETLITESVENTNEGTKQVEDAGKTMQEIVHSVERVTQIISDIAAASTEQSEGINQVNTSISNMEQSTQQNAALVEEAAAAAESLLEQANSLSSTVSVFKLDEAATKAHSASSNDTKLRVVG